jgi:glucose-6-phosphate isomerase
MGKEKCKMSGIETRPFAEFFHLGDGRSPDLPSTRRHLSQMKGMFADEDAWRLAMEKEDRLVYEFYELSRPAHPGELLFGTSIVYPGRIGSEYHMTKGHFHTVLDTAEVYYCLSGDGRLLMENPEGDWDVQTLRPGAAVYVPPRYAHRSVNTGDRPLVTFFVFRADAGHDYGTIESKGFRKRIVERNGKVEVVDNENWRK